MKQAKAGEAHCEETSDHFAITCTVPSAMTVPETVTPESMLRTLNHLANSGVIKRLPEALMSMLPILNVSRTGAPRLTA